MTPIEILLSRLDKAIARPGGQYIACCPAHDDKTPSLSIREVEDGRVLIYCFAGCSPADICAAVGLEMRDLFPNDGSQDRHQSRPRWNYRDLLCVLEVEANVIQIAAGILCRGETLPKQDALRLEEACNRVRKIAGVARAA